MSARCSAVVLLLLASGCGDDVVPAADAGDVLDGDRTVGARPSFAGSWGGYGTEPGQFVEPSSIEMDAAGFVYVAGHEDRVQKFTSEGELVGVWGTSGTGDGEFNHPHGLAISRSETERVYIGDQENGRVQVFGSDGAFFTTFSDPEFEHLHDVGIDRDTGDIFVGDYELDIVQKFTASGEPIDTFGGPGDGPGQFDGVWGISTNSRGDVYVADTFNRRIQKFDRDGAYLNEWRAGDAGGAPFEKPTGVFVGADDVVYVCDSLADAVVLFDTEGQLLDRWQLTEIVGERSEPEDIVLDSGGGHIYLGEVRNHRVLHLVR